MINWVNRMGTWKQVKNPTQFQAGARSLLDCATTLQRLCQGDEKARLEDVDEIKAAAVFLEGCVSVCKSMEILLGKPTGMMTEANCQAAIAYLQGEI